MSHCVYYSFRGMLLYVSDYYMVLYFQAVILVYDITDKDSFETLAFWMDCIEKVCDKWKTR